MPTSLRLILKNLVIGVIFLAVCLALFLAWAWSSVEWHEPVEKAVAQCDGPTPQWNTSQPLKVLSYNVQYMAGKNYYFFYDGPDGEDSQPSNPDMNWTVNEVARIIREENPDVVMLQEINDENDSRTHYRDQVAELQQALGKLAFPCQANTHYWQSSYILHPKILGSVSMKLTTLSRYELGHARRHQLPLAESDPITRRFYFQRAILETHIVAEDHGTVALLNTHFDAWTGGTDLSDRQVATTMALLKELNRAEVPWILGGDLNSLPPDGGKQRQRLSANNKTDSYNPDSEVKPLYDNYGAIPSLEALQSSQVSLWYTHFSNDPSVTAPDRTIDYIFYSKQWNVLEQAVRQHDTLDVSDHLPLVARFQLSPVSQ